MKKPRTRLNQKTRDEECAWVDKDEQLAIDEEILRSEMAAQGVTAEMVQSELAHSRQGNERQRLANERAKKASSGESSTDLEGSEDSAEAMDKVEATAAAKKADEVPGYDVFAGFSAEVTSFPRAAKTVETSKK